MNLESVGWSHEHALEDLREIPEVEGVVGLSGCGQELPRDGIVHRGAGANNLRGQFVTVQVGALAQPGLDDCGEYPAYKLLLHQYTYVRRYSPAMPVTYLNYFCHMYVHPTYVYRHTYIRIYIKLWRNL